MAIKKIIKKTKKVAAKETEPEPVTHDQLSETEQVVAEPVVQEQATTSDVEGSSPVVDEPSPLEKRLEALQQSRESFQNDLKALIDSARELSRKYAENDKEITRVFKELQKGRKRRNKSGNTKRSGFAVPTQISDSLCSFLGLPSGSMISRTEVTKRIGKYVRDNNLSDPNNGRFIITDDKLAGILGVKSGESVKYFRLQTYFKEQGHFLKSQPQPEQVAA